MLLVFVLSIVKGISLTEIRNTWISVLIALTGMTILLSTVGIKVPMIQMFVSGSLRAISYICRGIIRLITIIPSWIRGLYNVIKKALTSFGMNKVLSNIIAIIIIIVITNLIMIQLIDLFKLEIKKNFLRKM